MGGEERMSEFRALVKEHLELYASSSSECPAIVVDTRCRRCGKHYFLVGLLPTVEMGDLRGTLGAELMEQFKRNALGMRAEERVCCGAPAPFFAVVLVGRAELALEAGKEGAKEKVKERAAVAIALGAGGERLVLVRRKDGSMVEATGAESGLFLPPEVDYVY